MGTTVWQLPRRQIKWEPRWRTGSQPLLSSTLASALAVTDFSLFC